MAAATALTNRVCGCSTAQRRGACTLLCCCPALYGGCSCDLLPLLRWKRGTVEEGECQSSGLSTHITPQSPVPQGRWGGTGGKDKGQGKPLLPLVHGVLTDMSMGYVDPCAADLQLRRHWDCLGLL